MIIAAVKFDATIRKGSARCIFVYITVIVSIMYIHNTEQCCYGAVHAYMQCNFLILRTQITMVEGGNKKNTTIIDSCVQLEDTKLTIHPLILN
jgi:hypothetical protein